MVHRFLITTVTVASKGLCDAFCTNTHYAKVGGLGVAELNMLELEFLKKVDWKIVPEPSVMEAYYTSMISQDPRYCQEPSSADISHGQAEESHGIEEMSDSEGPGRTPPIRSRRASHDENFGYERDAKISSLEDTEMQTDP